MEKALLNLVNEHVHKITKIPNSCYTWAEEKLLAIDVQMPQGFLDQCIAISTLYVNQELEKGLTVEINKTCSTSK